MATPREEEVDDLVAGEFSDEDDWNADDDDEGAGAGAGAGPAAGVVDADEDEDEDDEDEDGSPLDVGAKRLAKRTTMFDSGLGLSDKKGVKAPYEMPSAVSVVQIYGASRQTKGRGKQIINQKVLNAGLTQDRTHAWKRWDWKIPRSVAYEFGPTDVFMLRVVFGVPRQGRRRWEWRGKQFVESTTQTKIVKRPVPIRFRVALPILKGVSLRPGQRAGFLHGFIHTGRREDAPIDLGKDGGATAAMKAQALEGQTVFIYERIGDRQSTAAGLPRNTEGLKVYGLRYQRLPNGKRVKAEFEAVFQEGSFIKPTEKAALKKDAKYSGLENNYKLVRVQVQATSTFALSSKMEDGCAWCGEEMPAFACGACAQMAYCSSECQHEHWGVGEHMHECTDENEEFMAGGVLGDARKSLFGKSRDELTEEREKIRKDLHDALSFTEDQYVGDKETSIVYNLWNTFTRNGDDAGPAGQARTRLRAFAQDLVELEKEYGRKGFSQADVRTEFNAVLEDKLQYSYFGALQRVRRELKPYFPFLRWKRQ